VRFYSIGPHTSTGLSSEHLMRRVAPHRRASTVIRRLSGRFKSSGVESRTTETTLANIPGAAAAHEVGSSRGRSRLANSESVLDAAQRVVPPKPALPPSRYATDFQEIRMLGRGAFGRVVLAVNTIGRSRVRHQEGSNGDQVWRSRVSRGRSEGAPRGGLPSRAWNITRWFDTIRLGSRRLWRRDEDTTVAG
jgi:hypothetical protein